LIRDKNPAVVSDLSWTADGNTVKFRLGVMDIVKTAAEVGVFEMGPLNVTVRRIRRDEWPQLRALRLRALAEAPTAFSSTLAREEAFPEQMWRDRAERGAAGADRITFIAERDREWVGLATGLAGDPEDPNDPRPLLVGMFVAPASRQRGVGAALVEAVAAWARARRAVSLSLWVTATNSPAIALYEKCGFRRTGESKSVGLRMVRALP
jgi:GNAT superfamily N-acetyltransferase